MRKLAATGGPRALRVRAKTPIQKKRCESMCVANTQAGKPPWRVSRRGSTRVTRAQRHSCTHRRINRHGG
eukprot:1469807-Pyramimonas_sp.AAC.1